MKDRGTSRRPSGAPAPPASTRPAPETVPTTDAPGPRLPPGSQALALGTLVAPLPFALVRHSG